MITETVKETNMLVRKLPLLGDNPSRQAYLEALVVVEYLLEIDETSPLIELLSARISAYEDSAPEFTQFNVRIAELPQGVAALRVLMEQYGLKQGDFENEIGKRSLVSQILNGKRALTIGHITALAKRFNVSPAVFIPE